MNDEYGRIGRLMLMMQSRWGARRYRRRIGAHLPIRTRRRRALATRAEVPRLPSHAQPGDIIVQITSSGFYEDDEPVEEIAAAFEAVHEPAVGPKTMTPGETVSLSWPPDQEV